ncbi:hypothetical protein FOCC_FOCC003838, partial [Frankliniella occidentalis]
MERLLLAALLLCGAVVWAGEQHNQDAVKEAVLDHGPHVDDRLNELVSEHNDHGLGDDGGGGGGPKGGTHLPDKTSPALNELDAKTDADESDLASSSSSSSSSASTSSESAPEAKPSEESVEVPTNPEADKTLVPDTSESASSGSEDESADDVAANAEPNPAELKPAPEADAPLAPEEASSTEEVPVAPKSTVREVSVGADDPEPELDADEETASTESSETQAAEDWGAASTERGVAAVDEKAADEEGGGGDDEEEEDGEEEDDEGDSGGAEDEDVSDEDEDTGAHQVTTASTTMMTTTTTSTTTAGTSTSTPSTTTSAAAVDTTTTTTAATTTTTTPTTTTTTSAATPATAATTTARTAPPPPTPSTTTTTTTTTPRTAVRKPHVKKVVLPPLPAVRPSRPPPPSHTLIGVRADEPPRRYQPPPFRFTRESYSASVPENSPGRTLLVPEERMGILLEGPGAPVSSDTSPTTPDVVFRIVAGDRDRFFKAEERVVGDFCFLQLRTRAGNTDVLNRERRDKYTLVVRATGTLRGNATGAVLEANTTVHVRVLDVNDLTPLFYPTEYEVQVAEDAPPHSSVARVAAEDADLGPNGEVYYALSDWQAEQWAVHPTTGVVSVTRPLLLSEQTAHELTVVARDRGAQDDTVLGAKHKSQARVRVRVQRVNLHAPEIYVRPLPEIIEHAH